jgi:serine/threonine-protein kinase ATR
MARKGGTSTQRPSAPVTVGNPPPSTIAAQIVNNATNINGHQGPESKIPFPELLREFLRNPIIDDLDPQLNVQFISTIAEAGLDALHQDNPFSLDQPKDLAIDSIRAINISIWQIPQLLLSSRSSKDNDTPEPPVFLWLFPKLLSLLDPLKFEVLQGPLQDLLSTCLKALSRTSGLWHHESSLAQLFQSSVTSMYP